MEVLVSTVLLAVMAGAVVPLLAQARRDLDRSGVDASGGQAPAERVSLEGLSNLADAYSEDPATLGVRTTIADVGPNGAEIPWLDGPNGARARIRLLKPVATETGAGGRPIERAWVVFEAVGPDGGVVAATARCVPFVPTLDRPASPTTQQGGGR